MVQALRFPYRPTATQEPCQRQSVKIDTRKENALGRSMTFFLSASAKVSVTGKGMTDQKYWTTTTVEQLQLTRDRSCVKSIIGES